MTGRDYVIVAMPGSEVDKLRDRLHAIEAELDGLARNADHELVMVDGEFVQERPPATGQ